MKKSKKLLSVITALSLSAAILPMSISASSPTYNVVDWLPDAPLGVHAFIEGADNSLAAVRAASEQVYDGKYSLNIDSFTGNYHARTVEANIPLTTDAKSGDKYKVSFYYMNYGSGWMQDVKVRFTDTVNNQQNLTSTTHNSSSALDVPGEIWNLVEYEGTLSADAHYLQINCWAGNKYFDKLEVRKINDDGTLGDNIAFNGSFEQVKYYNDTTTYPVNWGTKYYGNNGYNVDEHTYENRASIFEATDAYAQSGNRSLLLYLGYKGEDEAMQIETYLKDILREDTKYKLTFYTYGVPIPSGNNAAQRSGFGSVREHDYEYVWGGLSSDNSRAWTKVEHTFNGRGKNTIGFNMWDPGAILIDNISLYALDGDGNITGDNLMINGDFEEYFDFAAEKEASSKLANDNWKAETQNQPEGSKISDFVHYVDKGNGDYAVHLHYGGAAASNTGVGFYNNTLYKLENGKNYRVQFDAKLSFEGYYGAYYANIVSVYLNAYNLAKSNEQNGYVIEELEDGWRRYSFTHSADSSQGLEKRFLINMQRHCDFMLDNISVCEDYGDGTYGSNLVTDGDFQSVYEKESYKLDTVLKYYEGDSCYEADGVWIDNIPVKYAVETTIANNLIEDGFNVNLIYCVYKDGALEKVAFMEKSIAVGDSQLYTSGDFEIKDNSAGNYEIKAMYWNNFNEYYPYAPAKVFKSVE
ncbi:MAG: carbohydrate binding domain-containing protein [Clostridia bacterium]|nr:carbohydrate binding domain-containing protein [Clostridia bacterium]